MKSYKQSWLVPAVLVFFSGWFACTKAIAPDELSPSHGNAKMLSSVNSSMPTMQELATLFSIRFLSFPPGQSPSDDPTGAFQEIDQPFSEGIYFLGGGNSISKSHSFREVTIPEQYDYVFAPLIFAFSFMAPCDPEFLPQPGQSDEDFLISWTSPYVEKSITLECRLNKKSLIKGPFSQYRVRTPAFVSLLHAMWYDGFGTCDGAGPAIESTSLNDGYWVLIPIPDEDFELELGGGVNANHSRLKSGIFRNDVTYIVHR